MESDSASEENIMHTPPEQLKALPVHAVPEGLVTPEAWRLCVDGLVDRPLRLSLAEVEALGAQTHAADFVCEKGWVVPEQYWQGVAVAALLERAGVQPAARFLKVSAGAYTVLIPLAEALTGGALLARRLNGQPLTLAHGAPLRLVAPGRECRYSVKWVDRLEVLAEESATTGESLARADGAK